MFKARVPKAAQLYPVRTVMTAGTVVTIDAQGFVVPAANGADAIGFLAADVRDWASRTEAEILFPALYHGHMLAAEWINQPQVTAPKKVGIRIGAGYEYEVEIADNLVAGDELVADASGQLIKKPVGDARVSLAVVKEAGLGVGLALDSTQRVYIIRTLI